MKIKAVLFDCDGVLLDSERKIKEFVHNWLKNIDNYKLTYNEFYKNTRGMSIKNTIEFLASHNVIVGQEFFDYFEQFFMNEYKNIAVKMNNLDNMLDQLDYLPKAVCSNGSVISYSETLEHHGIKSHFSGFFGLETTKNMKPAPDMFLQAAKHLNIDIANCLIIDDSYLTGVPAGAACNAGAVVGFADEFTEDDIMHKAGADYIIRDLIELPEIINKLNS